MSESSIFQVLRRRSTGSFDRMGDIRCAGNMDESYKNSLGDDQIANSDSEDTESDGSDTLEEFCLNSHQNMSHFFKTKISLNTNSTQIISQSSVNDSDSETDEDDFRPELFGLLDNPGVLRFGCLDYPLAVTVDGDEEYETEKEQDNAPDRIRVFCDDLTHYIDAAWNGFDIDSDRNVLSRSLDDIHVFSALHKKRKGSKPNCSCNFHL